MIPILTKNTGIIVFRRSFDNLRLSETPVRQRHREISDASKRQNLETPVRQNLRRQGRSMRHRETERTKATDRRVEDRFRIRLDSFGSFPELGDSRQKSETADRSPQKSHSLKPKKPEKSSLTSSVKPKPIPKGQLKIKEYFSAI